MLTFVSCMLLKHLLCVRHNSTAGDMTMKTAERVPVLQFAAQREGKQGHSVGHSLEGLQKKLRQRAGMHQGLGERR